MTDKERVYAAARAAVDAAEEEPMDVPPAIDNPALGAARTFRELLDRLSPDEANDSEIGGALLTDLAMALRLAGSEHDVDARDAIRRAIELDPSDAHRWYCLGLLCKWRGRWAEGVEANQKARELGEATEAVLWNLAICATGARDAFTAAEAWLALGMKSRPGADRLPRMEGRGLVQIRVSTLGEGVTPAAHRAGADADYTFEHLWVEPRSPCHGVVVNATLFDLVVDYGDVVLWDGAPVGWREHDGKRYPRFPLLECLEHAPLYRWSFVAKQRHAGAVAAMAKELGDDIAIEAHSEEAFILCKECAERGAQPGHDHHRRNEPRFANGKFVVPHERDLRAFANHLDALLARDGIALAMPSLATALGDRERQRDEDRRWRELLDERREVQEAGVYRVRRDDVRRGGLTGTYNGVLAAMGVAILLLITMEGSALSIILAVLCFPVAIAVGRRFGRRQAEGYVCSLSTCGGDLPTDAEQCPRCGRKVLGTKEMTRDELMLEKRYDDDEQDESEPP